MQVSSIVVSSGVGSSAAVEANGSLCGRGESSMAEQSGPGEEEGTGGVIAPPAMNRLV